MQSKPPERMALRPATTAWEVPKPGQFVRPAERRGLAILLRFLRRLPGLARAQQSPRESAAPSSAGKREHLPLPLGRTCGRAVPWTEPEEFALKVSQVQGRSKEPSEASIAAARQTTDDDVDRARYQRLCREHERRPAKSWSPSLPVRRRRCADLLWCQL